MRSCIRIIAWILIFALAIQFFQTTPWLLFVLGGLFALIYYLSKLKKTAQEASTLKEIGEEPLGNILDPSRALTAASARALIGNTAFDFEVVGEGFYPQNFSAIQKNVGAMDGQDWDDTATLIADPGNNYSKNAVGVFVSGLKLGNVPEEKALVIYKFLLQNGGYAKADAAIFFSADDGKNSVWLDAVIPPMFMP